MVASDGAKHRRDVTPLEEDSEYESRRQRLWHFSETQKVPKFVWSIAFPVHEILQFVMIPRVQNLLHLKSLDNDTGWWRPYMFERCVDM
jgi:hypothetical protein